VAHQLNQPLGAILLNTETLGVLLQADPLDCREIEEVVAEIRRDDQRAAKIIKELSEFLKKKQDIEMQPLELNDVVQEALHILGPEAARKGVAVQADQVAGSLPVRVDPVHLQQVILNLAINAMDAMQDISGPRSIAFRIARTSASEVTVSVSDDGPGIPVEKLNRIFEAFYTTKQHGSGLGLSIARTIVEINSGKIWAENRPGGGASFHVTLPLAEPRQG
jgi:signal transduction histidine kinase